MIALATELLPPLAVAPAERAGSLRPIGDILGELLCSTNCSRPQCPWPMPITPAELALVE